MSNDQKKVKKEKKEKKQEEVDDHMLEKKHDDPGVNEIMKNLKSMSIGTDLTTMKMGASAQLTITGIQLARNHSVPTYHYLAKVNTIENPAERMLQVVKYGMFSWLWPTTFGKKPLNPILGENTSCSVELPDGSITTVVGEQVSHHPPIAAFHSHNPDQGIESIGVSKVGVSFWGTYVLIKLEEGQRNIHFSKLSENYEVEKMPNLYIRIFRFHGEYCDKLVIRCKESGFVAEIKFKAKPIFGGKWDEIKGTISKDKEVFYELKGIWSDQITVTDVKNKSETVWNAKTKELLEWKLSEETDEYTSEVVWGKFVECMKNGNIKEADAIKNEIEERQRTAAKERQKNKVEWKPKYFELVDGKYYFKNKQ